MDPRLDRLNDLQHLNTRVVLNCFDGPGDAVAGRSPGGNANSPAVIALHLVDARSGMAVTAGEQTASPYAGMSEKNPAGVPPLAGLRTGRNNASAAVARRKAEPSPPDLAAAFSGRRPVASLRHRMSRPAWKL